jgi:hypothetical protein
MAKIKLGAFITEIRGKVGGTIFSKNKGGAYTKNKVTPSNPQTQKQQAQRSLLTTFSQAWRNLSEAQRTAWKNGAQNFPLVNIFGDVYYLAGNMLYNRLNLNLEKIGQSPISDIPTPEGTTECLATSLTASATVLDIAISAAVGGGNSVLVRATPGLSAGISNFSNRLRDLEVFGAGATSPLDIFASYSAKYGTPKSGQRIGVEIVAVNNTTGETGVPTKVSDIVA